jgi:hypothetical protein
MYIGKIIKISNGEGIYKLFSYKQKVAEILLIIMKEFNRINKQK